VTDSNNNVDPTPAQVTITVTDPNLPPNGSISHDNGNGTAGSTGNINITAGVPINFNGSAIDPENDPVTYAWIFDGANASATTGSGPITVMYTTPGTFVVSLTATDINGDSDLTPAELTVNVSLPAFQSLPVLIDEDGNPNDATATYTLNVEANVIVDVVTPNGNWTTPMMRYNGLQLPPVIVAKRGTQMTFNVQNNLTEETTVHWHGFKIPAIQDGGPDFPILAAASRTYNYTLVQPAGPLWFHPHAHGFTATQVYNGLAGAFIVTDDITTNLETNKQIPAGDHDIALLIQDRRFAADNGAGERALIYQAGGMMMNAGMLGDHILVNGVELPGLKVDTRQYRFKLFNGSNARTYDFALADGAIFRVVGTDGGLLNAPVQTDHIMLGAGERAEIVVDFSNYIVGDNIMLVSRAFNAGGMMGGGALPNGAAFDVMRFEITTQAVDDVVLYTALPLNADINTRLTALDATATRSFVMSMGVGMQFFINGKVFDMNRVDEVVASGATEIWEISNTSAMAHPFHAHAIQWQILERNGVPASGVDLGWKDTVLVQPNEVVKFIGRFDPVINVGKYMYHCHILEHEEAGMMGIFEVQ
jgi:FtsP/CotA-like multicopper oxidase with cupredoxin domain